MGSCGSRLGVCFTATQVVILHRLPGPQVVIPTSTGPQWDSSMLDDVHAIDVSNSGTVLASFGIVTFSENLSQPLSFLPRRIHL